MGVSHDPAAVRLSIADDEFYLWPILHLPAVSTYSHSLYVCAQARQSERLSMRSDLRNEAVSRAAADLFRRQTRLDERDWHGGRCCVCGRRRAAAVRMERHCILPDARSAANAGGQFRRSI